MIVMDENGNVKVYCNAPPVDGKANGEILGLFSKRLKIPKSDMEIVSGEKGRKKRLAIHGLSSSEIATRLKKP